MIKAFFRNELGMIEYSRWEWIIIRTVFAFLLWGATWHTFNPGAIDIPEYDTSNNPNGLAALFNLNWLAGTGATAVSAILFFLFLVLYLSGFFPLVAVSGLLVIHSAVGAIFASPQKDHHATQVVGLVLLGQFVFLVWRPLRRLIWTKYSRAPHYSLPTGMIVFSQQMMCAGYVVSAISKWINSGGGILPGAKWLAQLPNIVVQFVKNEGQATADFARPPEDDFNRQVVEWVTMHPTEAILLFGMGFYLELLAFVALINRGWAFLLGVGLFAMHSMISEIMRLNFFYNKMLLLIFFINLPFWLRFFFRRATGAGSGTVAVDGGTSLGRTLSW